MFLLLGLKLLEVVSDEATVVAARRLRLLLELVLDLCNLLLDGQKLLFFLRLGLRCLDGFCLLFHLRCSDWSALDDGLGGSKFRWFLDQGSAGERAGVLCRQGLDDLLLFDFDLLGCALLLGLNKVR